MASMKEGICPNCNSDQVYTTQAFGNLRASGNTVDIWIDMQGKELTISAYVCLVCGNVAMFVDDLDKLPLLASAKGWQHVAK